MSAVRAPRGAETYPRVMMGGYRVVGNRAALALGAAVAVAADLVIYKAWGGSELANHAARAASALLIVAALLALRLSSADNHGLRRGGRGEWRWITAFSALVLLGTLAGFAVGLAVLRLTGLAPSIDELYCLLDFVSEAGLRRFLLVALVLAPLAEELVYRAVAVPGLAAAFGTRGAVLLSGPLFYALHVFYDRQWFLFHYVIAGWLLSWAFVCRGKLWVAVVLHALGNVLTGSSNAFVWLAPEQVSWLLGHA